MKMILNLIMAASFVLLLATGYSALERENTEKAYEDLAAQRDLQTDSRAATAAGPPPEMPIQTEITISQRQPAASTKSVLTNPYEFKENINAQWLAINPDFLGWIQVQGTAIDYPYVRSNDNEDYLTKDFYGNSSKAGAVFMDYRNLGGFKDQHLMLYGHNMKNGTMFHDLVKFHEQAFFDSNQLITISDIYQTKTYQIFSVYEISATDYTLPVHFEADQAQAFQDYFQSLADRSMHPASPMTAVPKTLLTLVTCSYGIDNGRTIIHAVEIMK